jgi:hypothetical protein
MARGWINKVREFVSRTKELTGPERELDRRESSTREPRPRLEPCQPPPSTWVDTLLDGVPLAMFIVGAVLSACTELIRAWAILGYLLLTVSPVVYWLRRIEKRLAENERKNR